ncbi:MAG TPA: AAA family ATPase [Caulobacteraceae bacterium]|nr:AAA family ATPase [Caulobacteraceae bacterium]
MLIIFAGLPGVGKTSVARELARRRGAMHLRIDTIEQVLTDAAADDIVRADPGLGYMIAYAVAVDNLRLGLTVIGDSVNSLPVTRDAWRAVADHAGTACVEVEVVCSDAAEHRRRIETRVIDVAGLTPPTWAQVQAREYPPWPRQRIVIDTAGRSLEACVDELEAALDAAGAPAS